MPSLKELDALNDPDLVPVPVPAVPAPVAPALPLPGPDAAVALPPAGTPDAALAALDAENEGALETAEDLINVRAPDGSFQTVRRADLPQAVQAGYQPTTAADYQREQEREYTESALGGAQTFAEQAAQGLTLGGYGLAAGAVDEAYKQRLEQRAEDRPITAAVGQVVGSLAPVIASGGAGGVGALARAAPAALTEAAGQAAARAFTTRMGTGIGARIAARTLESAADAALSSAAIELTDRLPDVVEDPDKWGEHLVAGLESVGTSALLGGAGGAVLGGLGELLSGVSKKAGLRALKSAEQAEERAGTLARVTDDNYADVAAELQVRPLVSDAAANDTRSALQRRVEQVAAAEGGWEDAQQAGVRAITDDMDSALKDLNQIDEYAGLRAKTAQTKFLEDAQQPFRISTADTDAFIDQLLGDIDTMTSSKGYGKAALQEGGGNTAFARVKEQAKHAKGKIAEYAAQGDLGAMHDEMAQLNRVIGKARASKNGLAAKYLGDVYENQRQFLLNEDLWGSMAQRQKVINEPWSERIRRQRDERIQGFFVKKSGEAAADPFEDLTKANSKTIGSFLSDLGSAESEKSTEPALREFLRGMAADATARANALGSDVLKERAVNITRRVAAIEDALDQAKRVRLDAVAGRKQLQRSGALELASTAAGMAHPALGFAISGVARIKNTVLRALAEQGSLTSGRLAQAANSYVQTATKVGAKAARAASRAAAKPVAIISAKNFSEALDNVRALQDPESDLSKDMTADAEVMEELKPGLGAAYVRTEKARAEFIQSKMPPQPAQAVTGKPPRTDPVSQRKLEKYVAAAYFPEKAMTRLTNGTSTPEDREVLKILYPKRFQSFVEQVEAELASRKRPPSYEERVRIAYETGIVTSPSTDPDNAAELQMIANQNAEDALQAIAGTPRGAGRSTSKYRAHGDPNAVYGSRSDQLMDQR